MKYVVDSCVYISALGKKDLYTVKSRDFFATLKYPQIIVPTLVAAETVHILGKQGAKLDKTAEYLLDFKTVSLDKGTISQMLKLTPYKFIQKTSDAVIALTAKLEKATLITWDKSLVKNAKKICEVMTPEEWIGKNK